MAWSALCGFFADAARDGLRRPGGSLALQTRRRGVYSRDGEFLSSDAFTEALVALLPRLRRYALSLCRRADLADDLVQTAAERAFAARARFDPATRLDAWMFSILHNAWRDQLRRQRTRGIESDVDAALDLEAPGQGPRATEAALTLAAVARAMATLTEEHRAVLVLVCVEELSYREAAGVLGIPVGTVMSRLARARLALAAASGYDRGGE
jgi:RNA polymerase sigma-70 factor (ECF subfamily)